jgi:hypothetical protein
LEALVELVDLLFPLDAEPVAEDAEVEELEALEALEAGLIGPKVL